MPKRCSVSAKIKSRSASRTRASRRSRRPRKSVSPQTKTLALAKDIAACAKCRAQRVMLTATQSPRCNADQCADAQSAQSVAANAAIGDRRDQGQRSAQTTRTRARTLCNAKFRISATSAIPRAARSSGTVLLKNVVDAALAQQRHRGRRTTIDGVGSLDHNKQSGLLKESNTILDEMQPTLNQRQSRRRDRDLPYVSEPSSANCATRIAI